jgi:serine/threonine protein kinase/Tfp pilus assembly protein PilF
LGQPLLRAQIAVPGYEILDELGRGGMGVVYKARHLQLKRLAALKVILGGAQASADQVARFRREAGAAARLQHPNIVHIYEIGEFGALPYFAQEYMDGGSLGKRLRAALLPPKEAAQLVATLAQAMQIAHEAGIIHRDLKPDNVLLNSSGICKITDFGLAKQLDDDSVKTRTDAIIGTPSYMAPEQAAGNSREVGPLSDVYALGAILYECLTGRPPFKAATPMDTLVQVRTEEPVRPRRLQPRVPGDLETICLKCLEKEPRRAAALLGVLLAVGLALPIAGWQYYAEVGRYWRSEQKRLYKTQIDVEEMQGRVMTSKIEDLEKDEGLLNNLSAEPLPEPLRKYIESVQVEVAARMSALHEFQEFLQNHEKAVLYAFQSTGEDFQTNRSIARNSAIEALRIVPPEGLGKLELTSFKEDEKDEIKTGCYFLLLMLAEMTARGSPQNATEEQKQEVLNESLDLLNRAKTLRSETRASHLCRARYLRRLGHLREAAEEEELVEKLASTTVDDPHDRLYDHFLVGYEHYSQNDLEKAIQEFSRALLIDSGHFWSNYFLGICYLTAGEPKLASIYLTFCQKQHPELSSIYLLRGFALGQMQHYADAERDFHEALSLLERSSPLKPSEAILYVVYNNRGVMRVLQEGNAQRAKGMKDLQRAIELFRDKHQAWAGLAVAYQLEGHLEEALHHFKTAINVAGNQVKQSDLKPEKLAQLHCSVAQVYLQRSGHEATVDDPVKAVPQVGENQPPRAESPSQRSDREAALRHLEEAAGLADDNGPLRAWAEILRGRVLHLQERFDESLEAFEEALKADPRRVNVLRWRGEVLLAKAGQMEGNKPFPVEGRNGDEVTCKYREAVLALGAYLHQGGAPSAAVYRQRGQALAKLDQHLEAIHDFTRALDAKPTEKEKARLHLYRGQEYLTIPASQPAFDDFNEALLLEPENPDAHLGRAYAQVRLGDPSQAAYKAMRDAEQAVKARPKDPRLRLGAARVYALAVAHLQSEPGKAARQTTIRGYQERAEALLRTAFSLVPADQQPAWLGHVRKDKALYPIGSRFLGRSERATP